MLKDMKKIYFILLLLGLVSPGYANLTGPGYYRVQNFGSSRWASLVDDKGDVDFVAGSADLHALSLTKDTEYILSDPGSIVYISNVSGNQYDIAAQGTSLGALINHAVNIGADGASGNQTLYRFYGSYSGVTRFIADGNIVTSDVKGYATINETANPNFMKWEILPVEVTSDNYFGAVPSVNVGGNLYTTLFTSFPYKPYSEGVKAYYIGRVGFGMAEMIEITQDIPTASPVIIQCAGLKVSDNKLQLVSSEEALPNNSLSGAYFNYRYNNTSNQIVYDPQTMRILGTCSDGSLGFITSDIGTIPANTAYLQVPPGSSPEFKCVSSSTYEENIPLAPEMFYYGNSFQILPQDEYNYVGTINISAPESTNKNVAIQFYTYAAASEQHTVGPDSSNGQNVTLNLSQNPNVPFKYNSNGSWILPNWEGGEITVTINILYQYVSFYSKNAAIESIYSDNGLYYSNNTVYNLNASGIKVMNLNGQIMLSTSGNSLDISSLPKGVYVAVSNGKTIKIAR